MALSGTFSANGSVELGLQSMNTAAKIAALNTMYATGASFGGGTLKIQASPVESGDVWVDLENVSLTAAGAKNFQAKARRFRITLTGATTPTIPWWVV